MPPVISKETLKFLLIIFTLKMTTFKFISYIYMLEAMIFDREVLHLTTMNITIFVCGDEYQLIYYYQGISLGVLIQFIWAFSVCSLIPYESYSALSRALRPASIQSLVR